VRVAYLLEQVADEFRALKAAAAEDGKDDVLVAEKCTLELGITWTREGSVGVKFWVLDVGADVSRENAQKVTVEMSLLPAGVPMIARKADSEDATKLSHADAIVWDSANEPTEDRDAVKTSDGGALRLAFMLEKLADEFRRARAAAANKAAILRYDKVMLELATTLTVPRTRFHPDT